MSPEQAHKKIQSIIAEAESIFTQKAQSNDESALQQAKSIFFGKKGKLKEFSKLMPSLPNDAKKSIGKEIQNCREKIEEILNKNLEKIRAAKDAKAFTNIDITLPPLYQEKGSLHPCSIIKDKCVAILQRLGFSLADGPIIDSERRCFDALNTPPEHPARNEADTFYTRLKDPEKALLRTHTSSVQIRAMERAERLPLKIASPGVVFRRDEVDATHLPQFHQIEGLYVDKKVSLADLKGALKYFFLNLFGQDSKVRFRPHYFPFTEPSFEIDLLLRANDKKSSPRWIEIAGCGMVDPNVFEAVCEQRKDDLFSPSKISGYAFGMGVDRIAMVAYKLGDIRKLIENDTRLLRQFN